MNISQNTPRFLTANKSINEIIEHCATEYKKHIVSTKKTANLPVFLDHVVATLPEVGTYLQTEKHNSKQEIADKIKDRILMSYPNFFAPWITKEQSDIIKEYKELKRQGIEREEKKEKQKQLTKKSAEIFNKDHKKLLNLNAEAVEDSIKAEFDEIFKNDPTSTDHHYYSTKGTLAHRLLEITNLDRILNPNIQGAAAVGSQLQTSIMATNTKSATTQTNALATATVATQSEAHGVEAETQTAPSEVEVENSLNLDESKGELTSFNFLSSDVDMNPNPNGVMLYPDNYSGDMELSIVRPTTKNQEVQTENYQPCTAKIEFTPTPIKEEQTKTKPIQSDISDEDYDGLNTRLVFQIERKDKEIEKLNIEKDKQAEEISNLKTEREIANYDISRLRDKNTKLENQIKEEREENAQKELHLQGLLDESKAEASKLKRQLEALKKLLSQGE